MWAAGGAAAGFLLVFVVSLRADNVPWWVICLGVLALAALVAVGVWWFRLGFFRKMTKATYAAGALMLALPAVSVAIDVGSAKAQYVSGGSLAGGIALLLLAGWFGFLESRRDASTSPERTADGPAATVGLATGTKGVGQVSGGVGHVTGGIGNIHAHTVHIHPPPHDGRPTQESVVAKAPAADDQPAQAAVPPPPKPRPTGDDERTRMARLMTDAANQTLVDEVLHQLVDKRRLPRAKEYWGDRREHEDRVGNLVTLNVFHQWQSEFLLLSPQALAFADASKVATLVAWVDTAMEGMCQADQARPDATWKIRDLAERCGLALPEFGIAIVYARELAECGLFAPDAEGIPTEIGLTRRVCVVKDPLAARIERARPEAGATRSGVPIATSPSHLPQLEDVGASSRAVRTHVWNVLHVAIFEDDQDNMGSDPPGTITLLFLREIWGDVLERPIDEVPEDFVIAWKAFRQVLMKCPEKVFYAVVEHAGLLMAARIRRGMPVPSTVATSASLPA